ncbi:MAG: hypothetical protein ACM3JG_07560, partial [Thiohalocapsa sp.]
PRGNVARRNRMRATTLALTAAFGLALSAVAANASPLSTTAAGPSPAPAIVKIVAGCGYGWHPTRFGDCIPNRYRLHRVRPRDYDTIEEWDEYDYY